MNFKKIYDETIEKIIGETYKDINVSGNNSNTANVQYGPFSTDYMAPMGSVILEIWFIEEYSSLYNSENNWFDGYAEKNY